LLDSLVQADESDFADTAIGPDLAGQKIGSFEIGEIIGRGGMGVVYLARDTKLDRSVAIKSIPAELQANSTARMRFMREAKLLASLNHPNIAVIHDIIEQDASSGYLVLEYIPGQTLAERIADEPVKLQEALSISRQIAEALLGAYEQGIAHRDLKPGNIKITPEGRVKVLDFGLAKAIGTQEEKPQSTITQAGRIVGTPAYMSPEQARGNPTDHRTDIWSFGCVMYEMLTGRLPFDGETATDTVVCVLEREPNWQALPPETPANIRILLRRCLVKDPRRRLQHVGDAGIEISETLTDSASAGIFTAPLPDVAPTWGLRRFIATVAGVILVAVAASLVTWNLKQPAPIPLPVSRFPINLSQMSAIAISPNGKRLVYASGGRLFVREINELKSRELPGTEGAFRHFFSADGRSIGFGADGKLKTLALDGGRPKTLCEASLFFGGSWGPDGVIYFSPAMTTGLWKISADEGNPEQITTPDKKGEFGHWWPEILPGGEAVLFTNCNAAINDACVAVLSLKTGQWRTVLIGGSYARYAPTGHLVYAQSGTLMAAPFDLKQFKVGEPRRPVVEGLKQHLLSGYASYCFSQDGLLYYVRGGEWHARRQFVWVNRQGEEVEPLPLPPGSYKFPRLSPDGHRLAFTKFKGDFYNVWVYDLSSGQETQLTFESNNSLPLWSPDGNQLTFSSWRMGPFDVYQMPVDRSDTEEPLLTGSYDQIPTSWSPDGKTLLYTEINPDTGMDICLLSTEDGNIPQPLLHESWTERNAVFSPNGNWIAYQSSQEGQTEIYVASYPELIAKKVSTSGGRHPLWSGDGKELFYLRGDKMIAMSIETEPQLRSTGSEVMFEGEYSSDTRRNYDVSRGGQRFLMVKESEKQPASQLIVVLNWFDELKRLVPSQKAP
jgi:serine/threonine-protein kinase